MELHQGGKQETNSSGTNLTSQRLAFGEGQEPLINPDELTLVSYDSGELTQLAQMQRQI
ncbi:hypothetical protein HMPREF0454_02308 [Hafnia alvei ATCC 51873]|uniref:Uncharacterized protein n=1 Tax=Hafnia alvei ATCC 51873 TaxID=1002364 RepID=G9Y6T8_HAFAL|nr:hypothetical protein HMPREF0454_02308 [Hafnia alvei ATCC 51873]